jgi:hypothetical protein
LKDGPTIGLSLIAKDEEKNLPYLLASIRVFPNATGEMLGEDAFRDALYEAMKSAEIDRRAFPAREGFTFQSYGIRSERWQLRCSRSTMFRPSWAMQTFRRRCSTRTMFRSTMQHSDSRRRSIGRRGPLKPCPQICPELPRTQRN